MINLDDDLTDEEVIELLSLDDDGIFCRASEAFIKAESKRLGISEDSDYISFTVDEFRKIIRGK